MQSNTRVLRVRAVPGQTQGTRVTGPPVPWEIQGTQVTGPPVPCPKPGSNGFRFRSDPFAHAREEVKFACKNHGAIVAIASTPAADKYSDYAAPPVTVALRTATKL